MLIHHRCWMLIHCRWTMRRSFRELWLVIWRESFQKGWHGCLPWWPWTVFKVNRIQEQRRHKAKFLIHLQGAKTFSNYQRLQWNLGEEINVFSFWLWFFSITACRLHVGKFLFLGHMNLACDDWLTACNFFNWLWELTWRRDGCLTIWQDIDNIMLPYMWRTWTAQDMVLIRDNAFGEQKFSIPYQKKPKMWAEPVYVSE